MTLLLTRFIGILVASCMGGLMMAQVVGRALPAEDEIVFAAQFYGSDYDIYRMALSRGLTTSLTKNTSDDVYPTWSPDGQQVTFVSNMDGKYRILMMDAQGEGLHRLTTSDIDEHRPAWSPDGRHIAYERLVYSFSSVLMMADTQTGESTYLTDGESGSNSPTWSPDNHLVAFSADPSQFGEPNIYTVDVQNGAMTRLVRQQIYATDPSWSPDEQYVSFRGNSTDPNIYLWDTTQAQLLTLYQPDPLNYRIIFNTPKWSSDSQHIIFSATTGGVYSAIYALDVADCLAKQAACLPQILTPRTGVYINPEWRPRQP